MIEPIFNSQEELQAKAICLLPWTNPFTPEWVELEKQILQDNFIAVPTMRSVKSAEPPEDPNYPTLLEICSSLALKSRKALSSQKRNSKKDLQNHQGLIYFVLYFQYSDAFQDLVIQSYEEPNQKPSALFYKRFKKDFENWANWGNPEEILGVNCSHLFAIFFQIRRAYHNIQHFIIGTSPSSKRIKAQLWNSIFTKNMQRYLNHLYGKMSDMNTLITGESGTGKELLANAIGLSLYIPFSERKGSFLINHSSHHFPINLSALSQTLLESELFGHKKGAFTGAVQDRIGYLEACGEYGCVFLDEIGETDPQVQVKLLRVLQTRSFQSIGDISPTPFKGKIIAATNRDLEEEIAQGNFREDFYYRLCSDTVQTPTLRQILQEEPEDLEEFIYFISGKFVSPNEAEKVTQESLKFITKEIGKAYTWPGNFRELEQCIRNIIIHGHYTHRKYRPSTNSTSEKLDPITELTTSRISVESLLTQYIGSVYNEISNYEETGRTLGIDRRTVKKYADKFKQS